MFWCVKITPRTETSVDQTREMVLKGQGERSLLGNLTCNLQGYRVGAS